MRLAHSLLRHEPRALAMLPPASNHPSPAMEPPLRKREDPPAAAVIAPMGLPPMVHVHYLKALLDWAVSQLVRQQQQQPSKLLQTKQDERQEAAARLGPRQHPREDPASWDLLAALLAGTWGGPEAAAAVPQSLLAAAAAACLHACSGSAAEAEAAGGAGPSSSSTSSRLLSSVDRCLRLLLAPPSAGGGAVTPVASSSSSSFRPGLEQCVTFVLAVLERPPPTTGAVGDDGDGTEEVAEVHLQWRRLVLTAVQALRGVVLGQPNTKKVRHPCATASMLPRYQQICLLAPGGELITG